MLKGLQEMFASGVYKGVQTKVTVDSVQAIAPGVVVADTTLGAVQHSWRGHAQGTLDRRPRQVG